MDKDDLAPEPEIDQNAVNAFVKAMENKKIVESSPYWAPEYIALSDLHLWKIDERVSPHPNDVADHVMSQDINYHDAQRYYDLALNAGLSVQLVTSNLHEIQRNADHFKYDLQDEPLEEEVGRVSRVLTWRLLITGEESYRALQKAGVPLPNLEYPGQTLADGFVIGKILSENASAVEYSQEHSDESPSFRVNLTGMDISEFMPLITVMGAEGLKQLSVIEEDSETPDSTDHWCTFHFHVGADTLLQDQSSTEALLYKELKAMADGR